MNTTVSTEVEIPEALHQSVADYIASHPGWCAERVWQAALSLFLMQNGVNEAQVGSLYLDSLFGSTNDPI